MTPIKITNILYECYRKKETMQPTNVSHLHFLVVTMTFDSIKPGVGRFRRCRTQKLKIQSKANRYEAMTAVSKK